MDQVVKEAQPGGKEISDKEEAETKSSSIQSKIFATAALPDTFPQGCRFSPDGLCVLTAQCHELALYNISVPTGDGDDAEGRQPPTWKPALICPAGDTVRSYEWYPRMDSRDPATCCFLGTAR